MFPSHDLQGGAASIDWAEQFGEVPIRSNNGQKLLAGLLDDAREQGLSAVHIRGADDSISGKHTGNVLAVLDPSILRSTDAKFNSADLGRNGLLLSAAGFTALPMLARETRDTEDEPPVN